MRVPKQVSGLSHFFIIYQKLFRKFIAVCLGIFLALGLGYLLPTPSSAQQPTKNLVSTDLFQDPELPTALIQQAEEHYATGQYPQSETAWQAVVAALDSATQKLQLARAHSNLSLTQQELGKWEAAELNINLALEILGIPRNSLHIKPNSRDRQYLRVLAQSLDIRGKYYFLIGNANASLSDWQSSQGIHNQISNSRGYLRNILNQAQAYQSLGQYLQAKQLLTYVETLISKDSTAKCSRLTETLEIDNDDTILESNDEFYTRTWWQLGKSAQLLGDLKTSICYLSKAEKKSQNLDATIQAGILLEKGHTYRAMAIRKRDLGKSFKEAIAEALEAYTTAADKASKSPPAAAKLTQLQAKLGQLKLQATFAEQLDEISTNISIPTLNRDIEMLLQDSELPMGRSILFAKIGFAESIMTLAVNTKSLGTVLPLIRNLLNTAVEQAHTLQDVRVEAYAKGILGKMYTLTQDLEKAQALNQQAIVLSTQAHAPDIRYRWHRQLGELWEQQDNEEKALKAYRLALKDLSKVRNDLLIVDSDVQFSFRDTVEPIYREFIQLLLKVSTRDSNASNDLIDEALKRFDELQLAEINNFLGCNTDQVRLDAVEDPEAAIIYAISLENQVAIVLKLPTEERARILPLSKMDLVGYTETDTRFSKYLENFRTTLEKRSAYSKALEQSQGFYQWFFKPIEAYIQQSQIKTLVFVLDGELRNIPMNVLHDGRQFLIEQYQIALSPRIRLFEPKPITQELNALLGGYGDPQNSIGDFGPFSEISELSDEIMHVQDHVTTSTTLPQEQFTQNQIQNIFTTNDFSVIHFKTHGQFSSDPEETFIVGAQEIILGRDLGNLIQTGTVGEIKTVDLLVLSSCVTAKGDNRAVLGITGIAVRAGARTVISSLWNAQDSINTQFMERFYKKLSEPNITRAEAFQAAQVSIIRQDDGFPNPISYWAPYALVGNWQ